MNQYLHELFWRIVYISLSFFLCFLICYYKSDVYLTLISYPYLKFNAFKRLIALNVSELFYLSIFISKTVTLVFVYPFVYMQIYLFFSSAWFKPQVRDYKNLNFGFFLIFLICLGFCYYILIPMISKIFMQLDLEKYTGLLVLELEPRVTNYLEWILPLLFVMANLIPCMFFLMFFLFRQLNSKQLLFVLISGRKIIIILGLLLPISLIGVDFNTHVFLFLICVYLLELIIFSCCWYK